MWVGWGVERPKKASSSLVCLRGLSVHPYSHSDGGDGCGGGGDDAVDGGGGGGGVGSGDAGVCLLSISVPHTAEHFTGTVPFSH